MTPERRNIAADLSFVRHQNPPYIVLMQYRVTLCEKDLECFPPSESFVHESIFVQYKDSTKNALYHRSINDYRRKPGKNLRDPKIHGTKSLRIRNKISVVYSYTDNQVLGVATRFSERIFRLRREREFQLDTNLTCMRYIKPGNTRKNRQRDSYATPYS